MILNVVHPYTYRLQGDTLVIGEVKEFVERDKRIGSLVKTVLDNNAGKIFLHKCVFDVFAETAIIFDNYLGILGDNRVVSVLSSPLGIPFSKDSLELDRDIYFIGGLFEACLANSMNVHYYLRNASGKGIYYIPELCVSHDKDKYASVGKRMSDLEINPISYRQAIEIASKQ